MILADIWNQKLIYFDFRLNSSFKKIKGKTINEFTLKKTKSEITFKLLFHVDLC